MCLLFEVLLFLLTGWETLVVDYPLPRIEQHWDTVKSQNNTNCYPWGSLPLIKMFILFSYMRSAVCSLCLLITSRISNSRSSWEKFYMLCSIFQSTGSKKGAVESTFIFWTSFHVVCDRGAITLAEICVARPRNSVI